MVCFFFTVLAVNRFVVNMLEKVALGSDRVIMYSFSILKLIITWYVRSFHKLRGKTFQEHQVNGISSLHKSETSESHFYIYLKRSLRWLSSASPSWNQDLLQTLFWTGQHITKAASIFSCVYTAGRVCSYFSSLHTVKERPLNPRKDKDSFSPGTLTAKISWKYTYCTQQTFVFHVVFWATM